MAILTLTLTPTLPTRGKIINLYGHEKRFKCPFQLTQTFMSLRNTTAGFIRLEDIGYVAFC